MDVENSVNLNLKCEKWDLVSKNGIDNSLFVIEKYQCISTFYIVLNSFKEPYPVLYETWPPAIHE